MRFGNLMKAGMALMMATSLVACGSKNSSASTGDSDAFVLGGSGPLSGDAAAYGLAVKNAAEIAVEEINAEGKVKFNLVFEDDQADGEKAATAFNNLMDKGMQISLGTVTSGAGQAVSQLYQDENIFAISPSGSSPAIIYKDTKNYTDPYGNIFQMCFTDPNLGTAAADYISKSSTLSKKVAIIYRNDDNYSTGIFDFFKKEAASKGIEVVYSGGFGKGTTDYSTYIKGAQDAGAELIFMPIYYEPASQILIQADKMGYKPQFFGSDGMDGILTLKGFDTKLAEGLYMLTPFATDAKDEKTQNFVKKYQDKYGELPNQFGADAYDAVYAIAQAIENSGVKPTDATEDITKALIEQFTSMTFNGVTGTDVTWAKSGEVTKNPKAIVIKDGVYVSADE